MSQITLYPLRFEPTYQYRLWGGRRLSGLLTAPLPGAGPIGEAWVLSDRDDHPSRVANGELKGRTIAQLMEQSQEQLLGNRAGEFRRFPLLLNFLDARAMLSVQVHPSDAHPELLPPGETGKTEAWVVLEACPESRIYAGLKPGSTADGVRWALENGTVADHLLCFTPQPGDGVFIPARTVHTLGGDVVVFEVQQNSDVTFRRYDWGHVDPKTGQPRALQVEQALDCINFVDSPSAPVTPAVEARPRWSERDSFRVGSSGCGGCADKRRLPSVPQAWRACWSALKARGGSSTKAPVMRPQRATYGSCLRQSERVFFGQAAQRACWKLRCRNSLAPGWRLSASRSGSLTL